MNHLDERYDGEAPDIWDHGYVPADFASGARAMLELCMFAEGSRYQEQISAVGANGKIECLVPGPTRFWPAHLGAPPTPQVIVSRRPDRVPSKFPPATSEKRLSGIHSDSSAPALMGT